MNVKVSKTFVVVTQESAEIGVYERQDFVYQDETMDVESLLNELEKLDGGYLETRMSESTKTITISSDEPVYDRDYYEKGEEKYYTLHIVCDSFDDIRKLIKQLF